MRQAYAEFILDLPISRKVFFHAGNRGRLTGIRDETVLDYIEPEKPPAAVVQVLRGQMALYIANAFANAIAFTLGNRRQNCEDEFADAVTGHVAAKVDQVQANALILQLLKRNKRARGGSVDTR